jgi:hypothetical protein
VGGAAALPAKARAKLQAQVDVFSSAADAAALPAGTALAAAKAAVALEQNDVAAAAYGAALAASESDALEALPGRVEALLREGLAQNALDTLAAFSAAHPSLASLDPANDASRAGGLDACDLALLRAKALAKAPGRAADADALIEQLVAARPDDFRPLLAKGLALRQAGRQLPADRALVAARVLAPKEARKMVDLLIGDR